MMIYSQSWDESQLWQKLLGVLVGLGLAYFFLAGWWNAVKDREARRETAGILFWSVVRSLFGIGVLVIVLSVARACQ